MTLWSVDFRMDVVIAVMKTTLKLWYISIGDFGWPGAWSVSNTIVKGNCSVYLENLLFGVATLIIPLALDPNSGLEIVSDTVNRCAAIQILFFHL